MTDLVGRFITFHSECSLQCGSESGCKDCRDLEGINKEIESAENLVQQAKTRRSFWLERVNSRRDLLTSKLPVEIVGYIFEEYIQLHQVAPEEYLGLRGYVRPCFFVPIRRSAPLRLGAVCRTWRTIAWAHSKLWKTLVIAVRSLGHDLGPTMVDEWIRRSGEQPLDIQMNHWHSLVHCSPVRMDENARTVVRVLNKFSSRWRSLDFSECPLDILSALDDTGCAAKSLLQHLSLGYYCEQSHSHGATLLEKSMHKHQPTHLSILCPIRPSRLNIEWSQLTHVYLENISCRHCLRTLAWMAESSPALCHLTLRLMDRHFNVDASDMGYNLRHPALESLVIYEENYDEDTLSLLFCAFTLPALRTLTYSGDDDDTEFPMEDFLAFLNRSACSLETLEMMWPRITDSKLAHLLLAVPTVRVLKIQLSEDNHSTSLFEYLGQRNMGKLPTPFLPNLARLDITAAAPQLWTTFIGIFADCPEVFDPEFGQRQPLRHELQVTFAVRSGPTRREMDLLSLWQLTVLWKKYQFFVALEFAEQCHRHSNAGFLMESYRVMISRIDLPDGFQALKEDLAVMSSLSF